MEHIFRRRHKEGKRIFYHNYSSKDDCIGRAKWYEYIDYTGKLKRSDNACYTDLASLPDTDYHPIEPYTGINDKNGKMIFVGDIADVTGHLFPEGGRVIIDFDRKLAQYCGYVNDDFYCLCSDCIDSLEVIGSVTGEPVDN